MMRNSILLVLSLALTVSGCSQSVPIDTPSPDESASNTDASAGGALLIPNGFYSVDDYDAKRDANADLAATIELAQKNNKRIILEIGGHW